ncbi:MAG: carboxypeptidase regulatory-like domain-containing protein [Acidobacteria bacterium]|nr:carboxypeptidase regulatory-like domain-containing protein [Acidobacteriota bacterium]
MRALALLALTAALAPLPAADCFCRMGTFCQRLSESKVIFLAETVQAEPNGANPTLRVLERFRGLPADSPELVTLEAFFPRDCYVAPYQPGKLTLVFLERIEEDGVLRDGPCTRSVLVETDAYELALIRRYFDGGLTTLLQGVIRSPGDLSGWDAPVDGAAIEAQLDGKTYTTTTDANGRYELANLPGGRYLLRPRAVGYRNIRGATAVDVPAAGCAVRDIALASTNAIDGRVLGDGGAPLEGVKVSLFHAEIEPGRAVLETETNEEGRYAFHSFAPGSYRVRINARGPTAAQPWDPAEVAGAPFYLGPAAKQRGQDIHLGRPYPVRSIDIRIIDAAGAPAEGIASCRDSLTAIETQAVAVSGLARCAALADRAYVVSAAGTKATVPPGPNTAELQFVLPQ